MAALHLSADLVGVPTGAPTMGHPEGRHWDRPTWTIFGRQRQQQSESGHRKADAQGHKQSFTNDVGYAFLTTALRTILEQATTASRARLGEAIPCVDGESVPERLRM